MPVPRPLRSSLRKIGDILLLRRLGWDAILVMLSGGMVLAVPGGMFTSVVVYRFVLKFQQKRLPKHLLNPPTR